MSKLVDGEEFSITAKQNVCYIVINSPSTKNAISFRMAKIMQEISFAEQGKNSLLETFILDNNCHILLLKSEVEGIFSSGGNLYELEKCPTENATFYTAAVRSFCYLLHHTNAISIALLNGPSFGGGAELALATDFRWGIGNSYDLHFTQAKFGIPAGWGGMTRLEELCPFFSPRKTAALILTKSTLSTAQLIQLGLVDQVFKTKKTCQNKIDQWLTEISECPKYLKDELLERQRISNINNRFEDDMEFFSKYFLKETHKVKIRNFLKKRKEK